MVDSVHLESDINARREALDVTRSFIVQAPAGSGKTELLIQRYLCLLGSVNEPEEVVAITFTRKAASEMQTRVIEALLKAGLDEEPEHDHERVTRDAARRILQRDAERGWQLLDMPRRMRIQTLDAFCSSITRLLPVSSGIGGGMNTAADAGMGRLYQEAAAATLDWLTDPTPVAAAVERVLTHLDNNVSNYVQYIARMLAKRDQWLGIVGVGSGDDLDVVRAALEASIANQICAQLQRLRELMQTLGGAAERSLLQYAGQHLDDETLQSINDADWPAAGAEDVAEWRTIATQLLTTSGTVRKDVNVKSGFPPGDNGEKARFKAWLSELGETEDLGPLLDVVKSLPEPRFDEDQWQVLLAMFAVLPIAVGELQRLFTERNVTDHVEIAQAASAALGSVDEPGELALLLDYRIRHLLVDEMQDTSIGQYRLVAQLTAGWEPGDGRTLFCVGDPMQSIYRFRDAEVGQFVAARSHGIGQIPLESLVLRQNFRSGEHLVDWFNTVFADMLPQQDDIASGAISYSLSIATATHQGQGVVQAHPLVDASPAEEAACSANVIERCLASDDGNVAVLVRARSHLPDLLAELRARGIGYEAVEIDRLTDLPEIIDLLALTRALCHDGDRIAWLALLRAPWVALSWPDIHALVKNDRRSTVRELMNDPERLATLSDTGRTRALKLMQTIDAANRFSAISSLRERVEQAWYALDGPACLGKTEQLDNVCLYLDVLEKIEEAGTLPDVALLEEQLDDERVSSLGDEHSRVQVMTMHKAKGLQFDHVVLHALGRQPAGGSQDVLSWLNLANDDGSSSMIISPLGPSAVREKDLLHRYIVRAQGDSDKLEVARLLYVACTRARKSLHLQASVATRKKGSELGKPGSTTLLSRLWPVLEPEFEAAFAGKSPPQEEAEKEEPVFRSPRRLRLEAPAVLLPPAPTAEVDLTPAEDREVSYDWVGSDARHAGTIVHRWLQQLTSIDALPDQLPQDFVEVSQRWARSLGVAEADADGVVRRAALAVQAVLADKTGRWIVSGQGQAELQLSGLLDKRVVNIVIDRVLVDDGQHWIIDYKTSTHEGGDLPGFLRQQSERYREQLRRYRDIYRGVYDGAIRTALYFPLLQAFVEVDPDVAG